MAHLQHHRSPGCFSSWVFFFLSYTVYKGNSKKLVLPLLIHTTFILPCREDKTQDQSKLQRRITFFPYSTPPVAFSTSPLSSLPCIFHMKSPSASAHFIRVSSKRRAARTALHKNSILELVFLNLITWKDFDCCIQTMSNVFGRRF